MSEIAFEKFGELFSTKETEVQKQRAWLKRYEGLYYSKGMNGKDLVKWKKDKEKYKYSDNTFSSDINKIERCAEILTIDFDDKQEGSDEKDTEKIQKNIEEVKKKLKEKGYGFIESTHKGNGNYIWIEFTRALTDLEARKFLKWIAPDGSEIDLNFANSNFRLPVLFAIHWKHSSQRELPIEFFQGNKIDYCSLNINKTKGKAITTQGYSTFQKSQKEIKFDYEEIKPEKEITNLKQLEEVIVKNFPSIWFEVKACLSVFASMSLKSLNGCPSLVLVGNPSGEKTTALSFFYGHNLSYQSDDFTPRAFVSHSVNVKSEELEAIDLLPKIKNKVLISPELAPLFEAPKDKLLDNFAILTRVLDGEGLNRDSGTQGHRGYNGDFKFAWLGATTPLRSSVWNIMGKIGNRLFFLGLKEKNRTEEDYLKMFTEDEYEKKVKICRGAVLSFLNNFYKKYPVRSLEWNNRNDIFQIKQIIRYGEFLAKLRGTLMTWKSEEKGEYEYNFPVIEEPPRAVNSLRNLAKGYALINDRNYLKNEDLEIVRRVAFSSMPHDRFEFLKLLVKHEGRLTTEQIQAELKCSNDTALRTMKIFQILGVVEIKNLSMGYGRPMNFVEVKPEFKELINQTQVINLEENNKSQEIQPVCDSYDNLKPEDFV